MCKQPLFRTKSYKKLSKSYTNFNKTFKAKNKIGDSLHG